MQKCPFFASIERTVFEKSYVQFLSVALELIQRRSSLFYASTLITVAALRLSADLRAVGFHAPLCIIVKQRTLCQKVRSNVGSMTDQSPGFYDAGEENSSSSRQNGIRFHSEHQGDLTDDRIVFNDDSFAGDLSTQYVFFLNRKT